MSVSIHPICSSVDLRHVGPNGIVCGAGHAAAILISRTGPATPAVEVVKAAPCKATPFGGVKITSCLMLFCSLPS